MQIQPMQIHSVVQSTEFSQALSKCIADADQAYCLPPACYCDESVLRTEINTLFLNTWISVGRADRLKEPGDFITLDIAQAPVIIIRDKQHHLRAFANSCRHRGTRLLNGEGNCRAIKCPFHSWAYDLEGHLIAATKMENTRNFDKATNGLKEFSLQQRAGFAFICMNETHQDIDTYLGDFEKLHSGWPLQSLKATRHRKFTVNCNWKGFLDVFNEHYHLPYVHPGSISDIYAPPQTADASSGAYASQYGETKGTGGLLTDQQQHSLPLMPGLPAELATGVRYTWVFPNMTFAIGADALWVYETCPLGPNRCEVHQTVCFPPESIALPAFDEKAAYYYHRMDAAIAEDIPALENQQRGLSSIFAQSGRFSARLEANVASFAKWYAQQLLQ